MVQSTTDSTLQIRSIQHADELRQALELMDECFSERYPEPTRWLKTHATTCPRYQSEHFRIAVRGERVVAALRLTSETLLIGESRLKVGGIGWMCVAPTYRGRRIARELREEALHYLHDHGFLAAVSFDEFECGHALGFTPAFEERTFRFTVDERAKPCLDGYRVRAIKPGDLSNLHAIHRRASRDVSCGLLREGAHLSNKWNLLRGGRVVTNRDGLVDAYFIPEDRGARVHVLELGARTEALNKVLMAACVDYVRKGMHHDLHISVPREHTFSRYLGTSWQSEQEDRILAPIGAMCVLDLGETLESMVPEWEACVCDSPLREMDEEVTLLIDGTAFRIRTHYGAVDVARQSGRNKFSIRSGEFAKLLTGYCPVSDVYQRAPRLITAEGRAVLQAIFPERNPSFSRIDCW